DAADLLERPVGKPRHQPWRNQTAARLKPERATGETERLDPGPQSRQRSSSPDRDRPALGERNTERSELLGELEDPAGDPGGRSYVRASGGKQEQPAPGQAGSGGSEERAGDEECSASRVGNSIGGLGKGTPAVGKGRRVLRLNVQLDPETPGSRSV